MSDCSCGSCGHEKERNLQLFLIRLIVAISIGLVILFVDASTYIELPVMLLALILAGFEVFWNAIKDIAKGKLFDEQFLMATAAIAAFAVGESFEAVMLLVFFGVGDLLQELAVKRARANIAGLMDICPDVAYVRRGENVVEVHPSEVGVDDIIVVKPGEKIALDGVVIKGESFVDTRAITGESVPRRVVAGDEILSGTINNDGVLEIKVSKIFAESTVSKILALVENAADKKSKAEKFITKFAKIYTPIVIALALCVALLPPLLGFGAFSVWIYRAINFLVISCPCALVISIPLGVFGGVGGAARNGILVKGGNFLEEFINVTTVAFDKTGTLTKGVFEVTEIAPSGVSKDELIELCAVAEQYSNHPIAKSVMDYYRRSKNEKTLPKASITERSGMGIVAKTKGKTIHVGNRKLMAEIGVMGLPSFAQTTVHIAVNSEYIGYVLIADRLKDNIKDTIAELGNVGITKTVMLTGDNSAIASVVAAEAGVSDYRAELLPQDKVGEFEKLKAESKGRVAFVGDGINDAPVLALSDIGIAMGGVGSDAAIESADVVIMDDDIGKIAVAKRISRKTRKIIIQNIVLALGVKFAVMGFAFFGMVSIWLAMIADVGVALIAVLNAARALGKRK